MNIGNCSTLLFGVGLVALVASCLQLTVFARMVRDFDPIESYQEQRLTPLVSITPASVARLTIAVSAISLLASAVFLFLDLAGMIVLRSRMWRQIADAHGLGWRSPIGKASGAGCTGGPMGGKPCRYKNVSQHPISWWQRWVLLEELVFAVQRNIALIRLAVSVVLAAMWSSVVVQLAVVSLTGKCRLVVRGSHLVQDPTKTLQLCDLLRKGMIATVGVWACWTLLAILLVFLNTRAGSSQPQLLNYDIAGIPLNIIDYGPAAMRPATGISSGNNSKQPGLSTHPPSCASVPIYYYSPTPYLPPQPQQKPYVRHGSATARRMPKPTRSSWSQMDEDSIISEPMRSDSQSMLPAQSKAHVFLQSQNMLSQFYHMQNQQLQGMHAYAPPSRISEEQVRQKLPQSKPAGRRMPPGFHKGGYASATTIPEPLADSVGAGEASERLLGDQMRRSRESSQQQTLQSAKQPANEKEKQAQGPYRHEHSPRSLASLRYDVGVGDSRGRAGDSNSKRNTIG
ncbi:hypothetical protein H4S02_004997 [Coemansia sp. RSA 2611]|nr:hypothetical protein H4S02_004997 [Coemansia sp. RSA 2611]